MTTHTIERLDNGDWRITERASQEWAIFDTREQAEHYVLIWNQFGLNLSLEFIER